MNGAGIPLFSSGFEFTKLRDVVSQSFAISFSTIASLAAALLLANSTNLRALHAGCVVSSIGYEVGIYLVFHLVKQRKTEGLAKVGAGKCCQVSGRLTLLLLL